jgi:cysteinyl-tRNA synthetase
MYSALRDAGITGPGTEPENGEIPSGVQAALDDDLNTPEALAELAEIVRATNRARDPAERRKLAVSLRAGGWLLGLLQCDPGIWFSRSDTDTDADFDAAAIEAKLRDRERLRAEKNFEAADGIRDELLKHGIAIEDGAQGTRWRRV